MIKRLRKVDTALFIHQFLFSQFSLGEWYVHAVVPTSSTLCDKCIGLFDLQD